MDATRDLAALHAAQSRRIAAWSRVFVAMMLLGFAVVLGRVAQLKVAPPPDLAVASGTTTSTMTWPMRRGDLVDRRGRVLATSALAYRLFIDPQVVEDVTTIAPRLANLLGVDPADIDRKLGPRLRSRYVVVVDKLTERQIERVQQAGIKGVGLAPFLERHQPHGDLAANVIGMVGFEHSGLAGFEHRFNDLLTGSPGRLTYLRDSSRGPLWVDLDHYQSGEHGARLQLSIDMVVQRLAEDRLREAVEKYQAAGGRIIVMDPQSGEILAMADTLVHREGRVDQPTDTWREKHPALGRNRCATDPYEPGSTFKPFIWAYATELGLADPDEVLPTPAHSGWRTSRGRFIRDAFYHEDASWRTVLVKSLNSGMAMIAERMSHQQMQRAISAFGFGRETHCGIPGETAGIVTEPAKWSHYSQTSVCMGHEIAVTPLQMVRAFSVFARDGTLPMLRLTAEQPRDRNFHLIQRVLQPDTAYLVRSTLVDVLDGRSIASERYRIFGKSGTAQLPKSNGGGYYEERYISSFIAGAPLDHPRVVALCVIDDPDRSIGHYGSTVAGPVVRDVIDQTLEYLGVPPDKQPAIDSSTE